MMTFYNEDVHRCEVILMLLLLMMPASYTTLFDDSAEICFCFV